MRTKVKQLNNNFEKEMFWGLLTMLVIASFLYAYFVNSTILNIVERKDINKEMVFLSSDVSEMEMEYFALSNKIDLPYIYSLGFKDASSYTSYASRKALTKRLSFNNNEI